MLIDWFTVVAQIINFLILVWFLKHFLYKPILNAIDERERLINAQINEAAERNAEAEEQRALFQQKNKAFDQERDTLMHTVLEEVRTEKQVLMDSVAQEYEALRAKRQESLVEEERGLQQEIVQRTQDEVFAMTRKVLEDLASVSLEVQMTEAFIRQIKGMDPTETEKLVQSFHSSPKPVILRSAFELPPEQQEAIQTIVTDTFGIDTAVHFEVSKALIGGIELVTNGYKVPWSVTDTLTTAGKSAGKIIRDRARPVHPEGGAGHGTS